MSDKAAPVRRKRLAKNKKKTWRTLARDMDELLPQETKLEVAKRRSGGFFIDVGDSSAKKRARAARQSPLRDVRCFSSLQADTTPQRQSKRLLAFNERQLKRQTKKALNGRVAVEKESAKSDEVYDMWDDGADAKAFGLPKDKLEMGDLLTHQLRCTRRQPVKRRVKTPRAALPACLVPASGASFNPSLESHQRQLLQVQEEEEAKERKEEKLRNQLDRHFPDSGVSLEARELHEMSAGLFAGESEDEEEDEDKDKDEDEKDRQAAAASHTSAKDAKEARRQRAEAAERKRARRVAHELGQLPAVARRVDAALTSRSSLEAARLAKRLAKAAGTKRVGKRKFEEVEEEFKLPLELTPTLRQLRPEGDLFVDAVKSLQRRNVLEPSERVKWKPRYRPKKFAKKNRQPDRMPDRQSDRQSDSLTA